MRQSKVFGEIEDYDNVQRISKVRNVKWHKGSRSIRRKVVLLLPLLAYINIRSGSVSIAAISSTRIAGGLCDIYKLARSY